MLNEVAKWSVKYHWCRNYALLYSIVSCASYIVLLHRVHFYMVLLVMY